jgi:hypothetical protein
MKNGAPIGFGRIEFGSHGSYNVGKLIAAAYNDVPYTVASRIYAIDGNYRNVCPENIGIVGRRVTNMGNTEKGVDVNRVIPSVPPGCYTVLKGGLYSLRSARMVGKYRIKKGLYMDFGNVEMGKGSTYNVGKLIAAAYNGIPYDKNSVTVARDGNFQNVCPENIVIFNRTTFNGKALEAYQQQNTKIHDDEIPLIRASTATNTALAKQYGVSEMQISRIRRFENRTKV